MPLSLPRGLPLSEGCRVSAASLATEGAARTLFGRDDFCDEKYSNYTKSSSQGCKDDAEKGVQG